MNDRNELDLLDIISYCLEYIKTKKYKVIGIFMLTIGAALSIHFLSDTVYESETVITTNTADYTLVEQIADPLQLSIQYDNVGLSASLLGISEELARKIHSIEIREVEPHPAERKDGSTFSITLKTEDRAIYADIAEAFSYYFNHNRFIRNITDVHLKSLKELYSQTTEQIKRLDSVQKSVPTAINEFKGGGKVINDLNLGTMYNEMIDLKKVETETLEKIELISEFKIITDFTLVYATRGVFYYSLIGIALGTILNLFIFVLYTIDDLIKRKKAA